MGMLSPHEAVHAQQPRQRRGLLGGFGDRLNNAFESPLMQLGLSLLGNARGSNWSGVGQDLRQTSQDRLERQRYENEQRQEEAERRQGKTQNEQLEAWIATQPPELQGLARLFPQGVGAQQIEGMQGPEWSDPFPFQGGTAIRNSRDNRTQMLLQPPQSGGGADAGAYQVLTQEQARVRGLPPGSYQINTRTNQVTPIGRVRGQYTEFAGTSAAYADRMMAANETLTELETTTNPAGVFAGQIVGGNEDERRLRQAQREFVNAILRRESGAVIADSEFNSKRQEYFPVPGDPPAVIEQKRQARQRAIDGLINQSQGAHEEWYGDPAVDGESSASSSVVPSGANRRRRGSLRQAPVVRTFNPQTGRLE